MKLKRTDFNYLGIGLNEYPVEEVKFVFGEKDEFLIEGFITALLYINNRPRGFRVGVSHADLGPLYCPLEIVMDIGSALNAIYEEVKLICKFEKFDDDIEDIDKKNDQYKEPFKIILEGMVKLREKGINTFGSYSYFKISPQNEGSEIEDENLWKYGHSKKNINQILQERNIERLKKLFEEQNDEKT